MLKVRCKIICSSQYEFRSWAWYAYAIYRSSRGTLQGMEKAYRESLLGGSRRVSDTGASITPTYPDVEYSKEVKSEDDELISGNF